MITRSRARGGQNDPRMAPQPPTPRNGENNIADDGDESYECDVCRRSFGSKIGLGQHKRLAHPVETNAAINVVRKRARWNEEEDLLLAKAEIDAQRQGVEFMNMHLVDLFPHRSLEAIKKRRQRPEYSELKSSLSRENRQSEQHVRIEHDYDDDLKNHIRSIVNQLDRTSRLARNLKLIAEDVLSGANTGGRLYEWLRKSFPHARMPKGPHPMVETQQTNNRTRARRLQYAKMQRLYDHNRSAAARAVLAEPRRNTMPEHGEMVGFWKEVFMDGQESNDFNEEVAIDVAEPLLGLWGPITEAEVRDAELDFKSAAGPDGISVKNWTGVPIHNRILIYNLVLLNGKLETELNVARTVFLPKGDGELSPSDFRPLSITSVVVRQLHKILSKRLSDRHKYDERQRAFINCDGTLENLSILSTILSDSKMRKKECHIATLDIRKAFDSVPHAVVIDTISKMGCPPKFIQYVEHLYKTARTTLQYGGQSTNISIGRGVLQGDPLSPLIFNSVMDRVLSVVDPDIGYTINGKLFNCAAFADDIILFSRTKMGIQRIIAQVNVSLNEFGLEINFDKSSVLSLVPSGRDKKMKVVTDNVVQIEGKALKQTGINEVWKYLGVRYEGANICKDRVCLKADLEKLDRAPLTPQQRLEFLKNNVLTKHLHTLVLGRTTITKLRELDLKIRKIVRKWLSLQNDTPIAYFHASVSSGGLGLMCFAESVPAIMKSRLQNFLATGTTAAVAINDSFFVRSRLEWCEKALAHIGGEVGKESRKRYWDDLLETKFDTMNLVLSKDAKASTSWVHKKAQFLSGEDYVHYHQIRTGCLPSRARTQRGKTGPRECRAGCRASETNYHVIQQCHRTHGGRLLRHDRLVDMLADSFSKGRNPYQVVKEPRFTTEVGLRKPDLLITRGTCTTSIDVQVVSGTHMKEDNATKKRKYREVPGLNDLIKAKCGSTTIKYEAVTMSYKGIFEKGSAELLHKLGITEHQMFMLITSTLRGSWLNWSRFNKMNTIEVMSPRRRYGTGAWNRR
jgi:hypothetical protein